MRSHNIAIITLILSVFISCNEPIKELCFVEFEKDQGFEAPALLSLDMRDTVSPQQLFLCARLHTYNSAFKATSIPIIVKIESPGGLLKSDTVSLPLNISEPTEITYNKFNGYINLQWPYRRNIINRESGIWKFELSPYITDEDLDNSIFKNITGLGISCKKEEQ